MMDYIALIISLIYLILAAVQYFIAPKIGPNPYLGFRIGYTFSDEEVWKKSNRFMGKLMLIHAFILLPTCLIPDFLPYFLILFIVPLILFVPIGVKYASHILEIRGAKYEISEKRKIEPIDIPLGWLISPLLLYLFLIVLELITYDSLPLTVAVHFDSAWHPNGWMNRDDFIIFYSFFSLIFPVLAGIFSYLGKKYPLYMHPGKMHFSRDTILKAFILAMDAAMLIIISVYLLIYLYAKYHYVAGSAFIILTLLPIVIPVGYLTYKWRR